MDTSLSKGSYISSKRASPKEVMGRIRFYFRTAVNDIQFKIQQRRGDYWDQDIDSYIAEIDEKQAEEIVAAIEKEENDRIANMPRIDPCRTVLVYAKENEHGCNWITAHRYKTYFFGLYLKVRSLGITTFIIDYATPFGLLVYEMLLTLREHDKKLNLYLLQSKTISDCKSFRLVPETPAERILLSTRADYCYEPYGKDCPISQLRKYAGIICTEKTLLASERYIPEHLLGGWDFTWVM